MHIADHMSHNVAAKQAFPAGWWLLPAVIIGATLWASLFYVIFA
jgi:hypothetical protein